MRTPVLFSMLGLSLFACRSDSNTTVDAPNSGIDAPGGAVHIQDVQNDAMPPGTAVSLSGVVVTAIDTFGAKTGDIWVEEPGGGPFSGVHVFGAPVAMVSGLAVGDIVSIGGALKDEFALTSDTSGRTVTELKAGPSGMTVAKTGTGTVPAPMVVDALAIGQMATQAARDAEWEKWEGVLITVNHVSALNTPKCVGSACSDPTLQNFTVTGQLVVESSLAAMPAAGTIARATCLAGVTGVVDYFFDYLMLPRATADIGLGGSGCPASEAAAGTSPGTCADGMDNDGNGFTDCLDLGCEIGTTAWLGATCTAADAMCGCSLNTVSGQSVNKVDTTTPTGAPTLLHDVFVTAVSTKGFWVADSLTAVANGGLFVFQGSMPSVTSGQKLATLQGLVKAFNPSKLTTGAQTQTEMTDPTPGTASTGGNAVPLAQTAAVVGALATGGSFAGSLVKLSNVKVKSVGMFNQVTLVDNANTTITMDDDAFFAYGGTAMAPMTPVVGTCYGSLTGQMDLTTSDTAGMIQIRTINPRTAADMTTAGAGTCTGN